VATRAVKVQPPLITSARFGNSLSTDQRAKRYIISMTIRVACFLSAVVAPLPWNVVLFVAAALLPGIAVLLGNARDNRPEPTASPFEEVERPALTTGEVVKGEVITDEQED